MNDLDIILAFVIYFLPTIVAVLRDHHQPIGLLNLLLGWTVIGWIIALIWSFSHIPPKGV